MIESKWIFVALLSVAVVVCVYFAVYEINGDGAVVGGSPAPVVVPKASPEAIILIQSDGKLLHPPSATVLENQLVEVRFEVPAYASVPLTLEVPAFDVSLVVEPGEKASTTFKPFSYGEFPYYVRGGSRENFGGRIIVQKE
jgi:hypothetical protein